jgi:hypothetical protein
MPEITDRQLDRLLDAIAGATNATTASIQANSRTLESFNLVMAQIAELKTDLAVLKVGQDAHGKEQTEMRLLLIGPMNNGIIFQDHDRIVALEKRHTADLEEHSTRLDSAVSSGKRNDVVVTIVNGLFAMVTSFVMSKWGGPALKASAFITGRIGAFISTLFRV